MDVAARCPGCHKVHFVDSEDYSPDTPLPISTRCRDCYVTGNEINEQREIFSPAMPALLAAGSDKA